MYDRSYFRESYYDHACTIVTEQDVLETDIIGNSWSSKLKRRWYNMLLLSYSDPRARYHFTSSHAIRIERARHFRKYRTSIHPMSSFRSCWELIMLFVVMGNILIGQGSASLLVVKLPLSLCYLNVVLEAVILLDLFVNTKTGYTIETASKVVLDPWSILIKYCSTKIFTHAASAIPLQSIMFLRYGNDIDCGLCKSNNFTCAVTFLYVFRLYRLFQLSTYWARERNSFKSTAVFRWLRILIIFIFTMIQFTYIGDALSLLQLISGNYISVTSNYARLLKYRFKPTAAGIRRYLHFLKYDVMTLCRNMAIFNFGLSINYDVFDRNVILPMISYFISCIFYSWGLLEGFAYASLTSFQEERNERNYRMIMNLAKCRQLPDTICPKISEYLEFNSTRVRIMEMQNGLYLCLPKILKNEIAFHCFNRLLMRIPCFSDWPMNVIEGLVLMLRKEIYLQQYVIAEGDGLIIVDAGMIAVYSEDGMETGHLIDGDYFGELSLVTDKDLKSSHAVTVTTCKVLSLGKWDFRKFMRQHPKLFFKMKRELCDGYKTIDSAASSEQICGANLKTD